MTRREQFEMQAEARAATLATRYLNASRCLACEQRPVGPRTPLARFEWRKQWGHGLDVVRVTHETDLPLCAPCLAALRARRRVWWSVRLTGGVLLALGFAGVVTVPILLLAMRLSNLERRENFAVLAASLLLVPIGLLILGQARRLSVPAPLLDMTRDDWECVHVRAA